MLFPFGGAGDDLLNLIEAHAGFYRDGPEQIRTLILCLFVFCQNVLPQPM
jgi:hypothetical protein